MFDKFGEFDTYEEFEAAAEGLMKEGDTNSLRELAEENGLDPLDAEDYITGETTEMTDPASYAMARIDIAEKETKIDKQAAGIMATIAKQALASEEAGLKAHFKGRSFDKVMDALKNKASKNKSGGMGYACGTDRDMARYLEAYYFDSESAMKKAVEA